MAKDDDSTIVDGTSILIISKSGYIWLVYFLWAYQSYLLFVICYLLAAKNDIAYFCLLLADCLQANHVNPSL